LFSRGVSSFLRVYFKLFYGYGWFVLVCLWFSCCFNGFIGKGVVFVGFQFCVFRGLSKK
jgi:hypothetical protein